VGAAREFVVEIQDLVVNEWAVEQRKLEQIVDEQMQLERVIGYVDLKVESLQYKVNSYFQKNEKKEYV
jgi:hypothetical protein